MRVAILSDIHDHVWNLAEALEAVRDTDAMIVCGDLCSPFVLVQLAEGFSAPIHIVFGNNDGDLYRITNLASKYDHSFLHGELYQGELGGKRFAANHYNNIAIPVAGSTDYDVVCYGHNHVYQLGKKGSTLMINPGPIMGYNPGEKKDVPATFVIYDTETNRAHRYHLVGGGEGRRESWSRMKHNA